MGQAFKPSPLAQRTMGLLRQAVSTDSGGGLAAISHRPPIRLPGQVQPMTFTVNLAPDDKGTFLVTYRELLDCLTFGEDEEEALEMVEDSVRKALAARHRSSNIPS